ncbi:MAG: NAD(P)H-dependent oxidoreductase [Eudoraea sp.]|nr:NAD(P)H-dependent oxidoreductase [Eudoraea sp.]
MENIIDHLEWRYAVKKFDENSILPDKKIQRLKNAFNLTATSYGLQPIKMVILRNKELQKQLVAHSWDQQQVAQASHLLILCTEARIDAAYISSYFERVKQVRGTSDEILNPFKEAMLENFGQMDTGQIQAWAKNQAYLAMGNLLTICAVEKIDSCPMEGFVPKAYDELLGLNEKGLNTVLVLPVGYRAEDDMFSDLKKVRRNIADSIIEIHK